LILSFIFYEVCSDFLSFFLEILKSMVINQIFSEMKMSQKSNEQETQVNVQQKAPTVFPTKAFIIGLVLSIIAAMLWVANIRTNLTWNIPWAGLAGPDMIIFTGLGFAFLIVLIPLLDKLGVKLSSMEYAIIYIMVLIGWTAPGVFWLWGNQIWSVWTYSGGIVVKALAETGKIPSFWYVLDEKYAEAFYSGGAMPIVALVGPILFWSTLAILEMFMVFFIAVIFRKQWVEVQGLPFPFASAAVDLTEMANVEPQSQKVARIFKERLLWIGFALAVVLWGFNIIHAFVPSIPRLPIDEIDLNPWGGGNIGVNLDLTPVLRGALVVLNFNPLWIAAFFLLPLDILQTIWIAMVVFQWLLPAVGISLGIFPDISSSGAWNVWWALGNEWSVALWYILGYGFIQGIGLWVVLSNLKYFKGLLSSITKGDEEAKLGVGGFLLVLVLMLVIMFANGASMFIVAIAILYFLLVYIGIMRYRTESSTVGGFWWWNWTNGIFANLGNWPLQTPQSYITINLTSVMAAGPGNIQFAALSTDAVYLSTHYKMRARDLTIIFVVTTILTTIFGAFFYAWWGYAGLRGPGWLNDYQEPQVDLSWVPYSSGVSQKLTSLQPTYIPYVVGIILAIVLMWAKATFVSIPFNPIGLVMGCMYFWPWTFTSVFLAWLAKYFIFKTGGTSLYQKLATSAIGFVGGYWFIKLLMWFIVRAFVGVSLPPP
jgi:hypothetical protein